MDFIFAPDEKRATDLDLEETFGLYGDEEDNEQSQKMTLVQRIKHEYKKGEHSQHEAIRVNLVSRLLDSVDELDAEGENSSTEMTFGEEVAYNTLFNYGFLKEI